MWPLLSGEVAESPRVETVIAMEGQGMAPYNDPTGRFNANNASILLRAPLDLPFGLGFICSQALEWESVFWGVLQWVTSS